MSLLYYYQFKVIFLENLHPIFLLRWPQRAYCTTECDKVFHLRCLKSSVSDTSLQRLKNQIRVLPLSSRFIKKKTTTIQIHYIFPKISICVPKRQLFWLFFLHPIIIIDKYLTFIFECISCAKITINRLFQPF